MRRTSDLQPSLFFSASFDSVYGMVDVLFSLFTLCADVDPPGKSGLRSDGVSHWGAAIFHSRVMKR